MSNVVLLRWPGEADRRDRLRADGTPRLLLVDAQAPAPLVDECLEDWVRTPASEQDVWARVAMLSLRARAHGPERGVPALDDDGVLRHGGAWVDLPPVEARLAGALLDRFGAVVSRTVLTEAGWPGGAPARNVLDVHILRLRRRLTVVHLAIRTVRSRGYLLEASDARQALVGGP